MTYDATKPKDNQSFGSLASVIRENQDAVEDTIKVDHYEMEDNNDGKHRKVTLKSTTTPTAVDDNSIIYSKDTAGVSGTKPEAFIIDEDSNDMQLTDDGEIVSNKVSAKASTDLQIKASDGQSIEVILGDSVGGTNITFRNASHTITAITQGNPAQVSATAHGLITGDIIRLIDIVGMTELNNANYTVTYIDDDSFTLDSTDASGYTAYASGGAFCKEISNIDSGNMNGLAVIASDGTLTNSNGNIASSSRSSTGTYIITFTTDYDSVSDYVVNATMEFTAARTRSIIIRTKAVGTITIQTLGEDDNLLDAAFDLSINKI